MVVECYGRITIYASRSSYQIIVKEAREISKQGDIFAQLAILKEKLQNEGLFDLSRKKSIPKYPNSIAILTSPTGAVLHDIMHRINNRYPCCTVYFFPIAVQGLDAENEILEALNKVENMKEIIDLVILARGGGSMEDLWVFNSENIVRKVANLKLPIISAIGHETDTTLVDFAADLRAPTPTAAAEIATPDKLEIQLALNKTLKNTMHFYQEKIKNFAAILESMQDYNYIFNNVLGSFGQKIDNIIATFINNLNEKISSKNILFCAR